PRSTSKRFVSRSGCESGEGTWGVIGRRNPDAPPHGCRSPPIGGKRHRTPRFRREYESNRHAACIDVSGRAPIQVAAMSAMVGLRFDLRVPAFAKTTPERQYAACLQMCEWADDRGYDAIAISEHHGVADGYMSSPVTLAAAIAACTKQIRI